MSTVSPEISAEIAEALGRKGVAYLRAPVSGSTITASSGMLSVMVSGPEAAYRKIEPILASFSSKRFYLGDGEEARYLKLVLNALVGATAALLGEALTLGLKGNLSVETMLNVICESAVASPLIAYKRDLLVSRNFDPAFSVSQMMKDFRSYPRRGEIRSRADVSRFHDPAAIRGSIRRRACREGLLRSFRTVRTAGGDDPRQDRRIRDAESHLSGLAKGKIAS